MDYLTVRETAETWNLSLRTVQQLCAQGRIPGAKKFGKFWAIPAGAGEGGRKCEKIANFL